MSNSTTSTIVDNGGVSTATTSDIQPIKTIEEVMQGVQAWELFHWADTIDDLTTYSFTRFFATLPTIVQHLTKTKPEDSTGKQIELFIGSLDRVCETLSDLVESYPTMRDVVNFMQKLGNAQKVAKN